MLSLASLDWETEDSREPSDSPNSRNENIHAKEELCFTKYI